jgi:hypothetical protein
MTAERIALIPQCAECGEAWLPANENRWRAYLDTDGVQLPVLSVLRIFIACRSSPRVPLMWMSSLRLCGRLTVMKRNVSLGESESVT